MRTRTTLHLTEDERTHLDSLIRSGSAPARTQTRARILLMTDRSQGQRRTDQEVADALLVSNVTVGRIRRRFIQEGMEVALYDKPRPGREPKITGDIEAKICVLACSDAPEGHARWTLRLLADRVVELGYVDSLSHTAIGDRLKKSDQALASQVLVHLGAVRPIRRENGRRAFRLRAPVRPAPAISVHRRTLERAKKHTEWLFAARPRSTGATRL